MIPVQLTIQGLYSYREKQTIDFTPMTAAHLFGIFGSVGSGKSTILEAITYAIYGRTDRLNLAGDNRFYNMMNLKSNELLIDFIFVAGKEQSAFRAIVKGKRNSRKFEEVKTLERLAYRKIESEWMPVDLIVLEEAIGLSYDNFKRTIIIPQGQFQEFLQLGNKDRTQMMKELFNLGKYEFFGKVSSLEAKTNARKQHIEGEIQGLGHADAEMLAGYEVQLSEVQQELNGLSEKQQKLQKEEENLRNLKNLTTKLTEAANKLRQLQSEEPSFREMESKLTRYEQCNILFKNLLASIDDLSGKLKTREAEIREYEISLLKKEGEIKELESTLEASKEDYEKKDELKKMAAELDLLARIMRLSAEMSIASERQKKGTVILSQTIQTVEKFKEERSQKEASVKAEKVKLPDMTMLANAKAWHSEKKSLENLLKEITGEIRKYRDEETANRKSFRQLLTDPVFSALPEEADKVVILALLSAKTEEIRMKIRDVESEIGHLHVKIQLQEYAKNLVDGDACPVCGSKHHPEKFDAAGIREELEKRERVKAEFEKQGEHISDLGQQIDRLESEWIFTRRYFESASARLIELQKRLDTHLTRFSYAPFSEETQVEKAFDDANKIQSEIKKEELELDRLSDLLKKEEFDRDRYQDALNKIDHEITALKSEITALSGQLMHVRPDDFSETGSDEIKRRKEECLTQYNRLVSQHDEGYRLLNEMKTAKGKLSGQLEASGKEREQENQRFQELKLNLKDQLTKSQYLTAEAVREILATELDINGEKRKLATFWEQLKLSEILFRQLQSEQAGRQYDATAHEKLNGELSELTVTIKTKTERVGELSGLVVAMKERIEKQAELRKELEQTEQRAENLRILKSLFKASGFVNYISTVYLQNLCKAANERFSRMTRQKLSLEITPDNNFEVRDYLNGGKVRSVKTLSGGQTFQAALSLALALADNIQKMNEADQNFFFLDEGFGSLDKESLSVVFDTLKSLRHENRIVGVISHVEEMQQEIEVHLRIENLEETGSKIIPSWTV